MTGEIEGMYTVEVTLSGEVDLGSERVTLRSTGTGRVLVRNPEFAVTMEHPETVAEQEEYDLVIHFTNQGSVPLNELTVSLDPDLLVATELVAGTNPVQTLAAIPPGGEGSVSYAMRSQVTGQVQASFFKVADSTQSQLVLSVGVGKTGERLTPYVISFPRVFYQKFPTDLTQALRLYAKKLLDFSQTAPEHLPDGITGFNAVNRQGLFHSMALAARGRDYGISAPTGITHLFSTWMRSFKEDGDLDRLRRLLQAEPSFPDLETLFGAALQAEFATWTMEEIASFLVQENERTPGLYLMVLDSATPVGITVEDHLGRVTESQGRREIPFAGLLPLGSQRTLVWLSDLEMPPLIRLTHPGAIESPATVNLVLVSPNGENDEHLATASQTLNISTSLDLIYQPQFRQVAVLPAEEAPTMVAVAPVAKKSFSLIDVRQVSPKVDAKADRYGRYLVFTFSKPLDLRSLVPLEDHLFINGKAIVDAQIQSDGRFLYVTRADASGPLSTDPIPNPRPQKFRRPELGRIDGDCDCFGRLYRRKCGGSGGRSQPQRFNRCTHLPLAAQCRGRKPQRWPSE